MERASLFRLTQPALIDVLTSAEAVLEATGNAVALCPTYGVTPVQCRRSDDRRRPGRPSRLPLRAADADRAGCGMASGGAVARWLAWISLAWMLAEGAWDCGRADQSR